MKPCCTHEKPHNLQWPLMTCNLLPGRHWFNTSNGNVMSYTFDEEVLVTNWSAQIYYKKLGVAPTNYDVRVCWRCEWDASYQPPEVERCLTCGAVLVTVPYSMMEEFAVQRAAALPEDV